MDDMLSPTVFRDLAAEVDIPQDGTLSRVLYKDDQIRLVAFGFDAGQELTDHTAAVAAIVEVVSGQLRVGLGDESVELAPGSWVHMPANLKHSVFAIEPSVMLLTLLKRSG
ncbi:MAG: cupin [Actinomycetia bacterium]|nr:cupin [Actinomycetes bacterium]